MSLTEGSFSIDLPKTCDVCGLWSIWMAMKEDYKKAIQGVNEINRE